YESAFEGGAGREGHAKPWPSRKSAVRNGRAAGSRLGSCKLGMPPRLRLVLTLALTLLPTSGVAAVPAQAGVSAYGMGALKAEWLAGYAGGVDVNGLFDLDLMSTNNVKLYRARFRQDQVWSNGTYSQWTLLDHLAKQAALRDVTLQAILMNMPNERYTPPTTDAGRAALADFAAAAARRY